MLIVVVVLILLVREATVGIDQGQEVLVVGVAGVTPGFIFDKIIGLELDTSVGVYPEMICLHL